MADEPLLDCHAVHNRKTVEIMANTALSRGAAYLKRLHDSNGAPVRVDLHGDDLGRLDELVRSGYAASRAEALRKAMRMAHDNWFAIPEPKNNSGGS